METKIIAQGKKNLRDYEIITKFLAGLVLTGNEIKSLRNYQSSINEAYILPHDGELYIINLHISPYKYSRPSNLAKDQSSKKKRKLLLHKKEINKIIGHKKSKNYAIIPLQLFINQRGWAKLEIALARHLRKYQIKEKIKEREMKRKLREEDDW
jgi:SsrA-binding protein